MKGFFLYILLSPGMYVCSPAKRSADTECCTEKTVGSIEYVLTQSAQDTSRYGCKDACVYSTKAEPNGTLYCFAHGELMVKCDDFHWCYEGDCGAEYWAQGGFQDCGGSSQSPIDLPEPSTVITDPELTPISFTNYDKVRVTLIENIDADIITNKGERLNGQLDNNGHTAVLNVLSDPGDGVLSGGPLTEEYQMLQLHFHWGADDTRGSEHTVAGISFPMELHIVHKKSSVSNEELLSVPDGLAVAGFLFEISTTDNPALTPLLEGLTNILQFDDSYDMTSSPFKVSDLLPTEGGSYLTYPGSLTTPPCSEAVTWLNFNQRISISSSQLAAFRGLEDSKGNPVEDNFRPVQDLNGREVKSYSG